MSFSFTSKVLRKILGLWLSLAAGGCNSPSGAAEETSSQEVSTKASSCSSRCIRGFIRHAFEMSFQPVGESFGKKEFRDSQDFGDRFYQDFVQPFTDHQLEDWAAFPGVIDSDFPVYYSPLISRSNFASSFTISLSGSQAKSQRIRSSEGNFSIDDLDPADTYSLRIHNTWSIKYRKSGSEEIRTQCLTIERKIDALRVSENSITEIGGISDFDFYYHISDDSCVSVAVLEEFQGGRISITAVKPPGHGTSTKPFEISSIEEFMWMGQVPDIRNPSTQHFRLMVDLDFQGHTIEPLERADHWNYGGLDFDGQGYSILNLVVASDTNTTKVGIFRDLKGVVKNLKVMNIHVEGDSYVGAIAGEIFSSSSPESGPSGIQNCRITGTVIGKRLVGGVFGVVSGDFLTEIDGAVLDIEIAGSSISTGGVFGKTRYTKISNVLFIGKSEGGSLVGESHKETLVKQTLALSAPLIGLSSFGPLTPASDPATVESSVYFLYGESAEGQKLDGDAIYSANSYHDWEFSNVWMLPDSSKKSLPRLRWEMR